MALALIDGNLQNQAILVAINEDLFDLLDMAALNAFFPQFFSRPAVICRHSSLDGHIEGFPIHISDHEYLACRAVLRDRGNKAFIIEFRLEFDAFFDIFICCQFNFLSERTLNYNLVSECFTRYDS